MKMEKILLRIACLLMCLMLVLPTFICLAFETPPMDGADDMAAGAVQAAGLGEGINTVIGIIQVIGTGASIIMVTMLGIKYLAAGPNEKVDVKKHMAPMLIGSILLFSSVNVVKIIFSIAQKLPDS